MVTNDHNAAMAKKSNHCDCVSYILSVSPHLFQLLTVKIEAKNNSLKKKTCPQLCVCECFYVGVCMCVDTGLWYVSESLNSCKIHICKVTISAAQMSIKYSILYDVTPHESVKCLKSSFLSMCVTGVQKPDNQKVSWLRCQQASEQHTQDTGGGWHCWLTCNLLQTIFSVAFCISEGDLKNTNTSLYNAIHLNQQLSVSLLAC